MMRDKLFPWRMAQWRKKIMDPVAKFWKEWRDTWVSVYDPDLKRKSDEGRN